MKLSVWLKGKEQSAFARKLGRDPGTISRVASGHRTASFALAIAIETASDGEVRAEELPLSERAKGELALFRREQARGTAA